MNQFYAMIKSLYIYIYNNPPSSLYFRSHLCILQVTHHQSMHVLLFLVVLCSYFRTNITNKNTWLKIHLHAYSYKNAHKIGAQFPFSSEASCDCS